MTYRKNLNRRLKRKRWAGRYWRVFYQSTRDYLKRTYIEGYREGYEDGVREGKQAILDSVFPSVHVEIDV